MWIVKKTLSIFKELEKQISYTSKVFKRYIDMIRDGERNFDAYINFRDVLSELESTKYPNDLLSHVGSEFMETLKHDSEHQRKLLFSQEYYHDRSEKLHHDEKLKKEYDQLRLETEEDDLNRDMSFNLNDTKVDEETK